MNMRSLPPGPEQAGGAGKEFAAQRAMLGDRAVYWASRFEQVSAELIALKEQRARLQAECEALQARVAALEGQAAVEDAAAVPEAAEGSAAA